MENAIIKKVRPLSFQWETSDPFIFCVHHEDFFPKGNGQLGPDAPLLSGRCLGQDFTVKDGFRMYHGERIPGFPEHPHRGFETVTVVQRGMVDHADSLGGAGRYGGGDTQWMTAGKGIQHSEMFPLINESKDNTMELFQIWLNLPAKNKMVAPHYKMLWREDIPVFVSEDQKTRVLIVAGELAGTKAPSPPPSSWAADPQNEVAIWIIDMLPEAQILLPQASAGVNRTLYFFKGKTVKVAGATLNAYHAAELDSEQECFIENGSEPSRLLLLQGKPINEPVVQHGPFVMNNRQEIEDALSDFQTTHFGGWPWPVRNPTHGGETTRFAKHGDGQMEERHEGGIL
ncbi:MAG: redox-sensitive bicupin YhaK (pirin superfamily) [Desulforhopalus sp.]|jgi:redox-sensitive bicupin YhaK (pirin superfamily)